ncbi:hypothetical protein VE00_06475 [Pseudogymnoascus sp. WSF 3629]|nr:hypothetical protein VE00_06475 [Pseudogymnoascus sp. WSF 3629]
MDNPEAPGGKRKRSISTAMPQQTRQPVQPQTPGNVPQINYLAKARSGKMRLIEGDADDFGNILGLIDDYEGVLQRHESLAANLGVKLVGPLLLKSVEKLFEGPIKVTTTYPAEAVTITWLDVLDFARSTPQNFVLSESRGGGRVCQFWINQCSVEISEDDYRLIISGAPERMLPTQPILDDEVAELGTMDILEQRLSMLIKRADLVAARARQLNYHLKGRKSAIASRRVVAQSPEQTGASSSAQFMTNQTQASTSNGEGRSIHLDLLRQFQHDDRKGMPSRIKGSHSQTDATGSPMSGGSPTPTSFGRRVTAPMPSGADDGTGGQYRPLIAARIEKMNRNDPIWPPCDRCRRLRMECTKYLTACGGCTKKHAKCSWRDITEEEIAFLIQIPEPSIENEDGALEVADMNANLDPDLRLMNGGGMHLGGHGSEGLIGPGEGKRGDVLTDEHSILTQMASAAATEGNR